MTNKTFYYTDMFFNVYVCLYLRLAQPSMRISCFIYFRSLLLGHIPSLAFVTGNNVTNKKKRSHNNKKMLLPKIITRQCVSCARRDFIFLCPPCPRYETKEILVKFHSSIKLRRKTVLEDQVVN